MNRGQLPTKKLIGIHSTMHLMHPNYCQITIIIMYTISCLWNIIIIILSCAHNYGVHTHNNSRITSTSRWSQRDHLMESLVLVSAAIPYKREILLMMHKILLLNQVL